MTGIGPVIAWRRASRYNLQRNFRLPVLVLLAAGVAAVALGLRAWYAVSVVAFGAFVAATVIQEMWRGTRARMASKGAGPAAALIGLIGRNRRRYGGYVVHLGVLFVFAGIAGSMFQLEQEARLSPGDELAIGDYRIEYLGGDIEQGPNYAATVANLTVREGDGTPYRVRPERRFYPSGQEQTTSEVAIWSRMFEDFYAILEGFDPATGTADVTLIVNPLLQWIWVGGGIMVIGTLISLSSPRPKPARKREPSAETAAAATA
jgi:cytochrome c-type biogenesis protein CcmF